MKMFNSYTFFLATISLLDTSIKLCRNYGTSNRQMEKIRAKPGALMWLNFAVCRERLCDLVLSGKTKRFNQTCTKILIFY